MTVCGISSVGQVTNISFDTWWEVEGVGGGRGGLQHWILSTKSNQLFFTPRRGEGEERARVWKKREEEWWRWWF